MANKSAGGVSIDLETHALDAAGRPVLGLFAAGELTGSAGMNGLSGLDGMFTGPSILTGRVAGRTAAAELADVSGWEPAAFTRRGGDWSLPPAAGASWTAALGHDDLRPMLAESRDGYWHFERVHNLVLERSYDCAECHSATLPFYAARSRAEKAVQAQTCDACHLAPAGTLPAADAARAPVTVRERRPGS